MQEVTLVGILNITPDSFSGDGITNAKEALGYADDLFLEGAGIVDVGAEATNPWAHPITPAEEWRRLTPILASLIAAQPGRISVDTHHPTTVEHIAHTCGTAFIVNDVSGMNDPRMRTVVATHNLHCIVSHLPATFGTNIQEAHANADLDDGNQVLDELLVRRQQLIDLGLPAKKIILDPGIGFGKTMRLNWELLQFAELVKKAGTESEVLIGYSHKRFLGQHRFEINQNLEAARIAIAAGANYLRVHDVAAHNSFLQAQIK